MKLPETPPQLKLATHQATDPQAQELHQILALLPTDIGKDREGEYQHWDKLKHTTLPKGIESHTHWWLLT